MEIDKSKFYVFYDGECGFCNFWVHWILERDDKDNFLFASLQSELGQQFLGDRGLSLDDLDTLYVWKPQDFYMRKSHAIFKITEVIGGKYGLISYLRFLPTPITDFFYDRIAENRKNLASQTCPFPTPEQRKKLLG